MELRKAFGATLRQVRLQKNLTQEDFALVSSRTNVSLLERGGTSPTLDKLEELCSVLAIHPVSLVAACYMRKENTGDVRRFLSRVQEELQLMELKGGRGDI
ncbi:helix-turn-helix domain-containing protein [Pseudomonas sp. YuFO8]|jgi:transcriptional regulator with XRE-family HTH domain|uniref:helix-turn-helix domain-containing protein n=1 Tax=Pseudomonas sp. YuFO8 TaxID=3095361 RepID=UPI002B24B6E3|nr:helix-turn-helix transcriptional regulator [Pseudomonas sp. YuFO8]MEB2621060.1 helix-turn-helix transcriptional regulator [Pseudomonas sp. YuFO8]